MRPGRGEAGQQAFLLDRVELLGVQVAFAIGARQARSQEQRDVDVPSGGSMRGSFPAGSRPKPRWPGFGL